MIVFLAIAMSIWGTLLLVCLVAINILFWNLITQRTMEGRRVLDGIEGVRMYLSAAEERSLQTLHPPNKTPELFEKYLPYALALDVENEWAEQFAGDFFRTFAGHQSRGFHQPSWYQGHAWSPNTIGTFTSGVGDAIASSSTAPGSSRGSSRGGTSGFSGGSSGGGGGGGW